MIHVVTHACDGPRIAPRSTPLQKSLKGRLAWSGTLVPSGWSPRRQELTDSLRTLRQTPLARCTAGVQGAAIRATRRRVRPAPSPSQPRTPAPLQAPALAREQGRVAGIARQAQAPGLALSIAETSSNSCAVAEACRVFSGHRLRPSAPEGALEAAVRSRTRWRLEPKPLSRSGP